MINGSGHYLGRLMRMHMRVDVGRSVEGHKYQPEHIERRDEGAADAHAPIDDIAVYQRVVQNFVLTEESREREYPCDRNCGNQKRDVSDWKMILESAHFADVLFVMHTVDDASGTEEQAGFEERVSDQVENRGGVSPDAAGQEHVSDLADGGVGQHAFDVVLAGADGRRE